jgi:hypothetical protein
MEALFFDFEANDIAIKSDGSFKTSDTGSQNCALIANSQICRLTVPEKGEQLVARILNGKTFNINADIAKAKRAVEKDGGTNVKISLVDGQLTYNATYES